MDKYYWNKYYKSNYSPFKPSEFAKYVLKDILSQRKIIDIGCGNGRDSLLFAKNLIYTTGVDQSSTVITSLKHYETDYLQFKNIDFTKMSSEKFDYGYCRFIFHSINENEEDLLLNWLALNISNKIYIEARIDIDSELYSETNHYRRLMNLDKFKSKLKVHNLKIDYEEISNKFSLYNENYNVQDIQFNPSLVRLIVSKK